MLLTCSTLSVDKREQQVLETDERITPFIDERQKGD
jgi:hypothetical protein